MNKVLMRPMFRKVYLETQKKDLEVKKFKVGGLSSIEKRNLLLTPITSALLQARRLPGESTLGSLARTVGQGMAAVPTVASQIADLDDDETTEKFEFVADEDLPEELKGKGAYQRNITTGEYKKVGREKEAKEKDTFRILTDAEAKEQLGSAYQPDFAYQINENTNKIDILSKSGTEVNIGGEADPYTKEVMKEVGKKDAEEYGESRTAFNNANQLDQILDQLDVLASMPDDELRTGALGEFRLSATKFLNDIGIPADFQNVPLAEVLRTVGGKLTIDNLKGFKGAISNKELEFVQDVTPGLSMSKDGIRLNNALTRRANEINKKYYLEVMEPFIEANKGLQGKLNGKTLGQLKKEFHESNPLITDEIKTQINATMNKIDPEFEMEVVTDEATGKQYIHLGGGRYAPYDGK
tara:strand:- start:72 stop:1304 length:1233 start_codon:yes stop_codon:yes gene_type:complete